MKLAERNVGQTTLTPEEEKKLVWDRVYAYTATANAIDLANEIAALPGVTLKMVINAFLHARQNKLGPDWAIARLRTQLKGAG